VGKTFLIKEVYKGKIDFELTGLQNAPKNEQLQNFSYQLAEFMGINMPLKEPKNWLEAFRLLINFLKTKKSKSKQVIFLDELPWLATPKSGFLRGLSYFWNSWAVNNDIVVVICGSAASWMIQKVVNHKGGLHNRITKRIQLYPFNLLETEEYLQSRNIVLNRYQEKAPFKILMTSAFQSQVFSEMNFQNYILHCLIMQKSTLSLLES